MESESYQETKPERKRGITLMGYFVPWWAVVVVLLVALYLAHEQGYLSGMTGSQKLAEAKPVELQGQVLSIGGASTPEDVRRLFNGRW